MVRDANLNVRGRVMRVLGSIELRYKISTHPPRAPDTLLPAIDPGSGPSIPVRDCPDALFRIGHVPQVRDSPVELFDRDRLKRRLDASDLADWKEIRYRTFRETVTDESSPYPCYFAVEAQREG